MKQKRERNQPKAKKKVKIAEQMFPMMAETAKLQKSLTFSMKSPNEENEDIEKRDGYR